MIADIVVAEVSNLALGAATGPNSGQSRFYRNASTRPPVELGAALLRYCIALSQSAHGSRVAIDITFRRT